MLKATHHWLQPFRLPPISGVVYLQHLSMEGVILLSTSISWSLNIPHLSTAHSQRQRHTKATGPLLYSKFFTRLLHSGASSVHWLRKRVTVHAQRHRTRINLPTNNTPTPTDVLNLQQHETWWCSTDPSNYSPDSENVGWQSSARKTLPRQRVEHIEACPSPPIKVWLGQTGTQEFARERMR